MSTKSTSPNPMDLFRTPAMRTITLVLSLSWFTTSFCYFPIAMDVQRFGLSMYLTQVVFAASEFPMRLLSTIGAFYIGRRVTIAFLLILSGTLLLCTMAIPTDMTVLQMILTAVAKSIIGSCIVCSYLYTTELYPTVLRQTGMGFTNMMMRLGAVVAPIVMITKAYVSFLPLVIFGVMPIISGLPILWLPETKDCALLDTVEEVETRAWKLKTPAITQNNNIVHGTKV
ncbi:hypothetical protein GDO86_008685 [Hymenochirus boettgeri]|uniref:Uncharacterized protein n=1 Tax=Hymenochirus boettgeri TaxID=247094 RepID=A0A8T2IYI5_9PIPI|nr:hypothetical protein GDO86_008685 [Hymenochirus boettgeri]